MYGTLYISLSIFMFRAYDSPEKPAHRAPTAGYVTTAAQNGVGKVTAKLPHPIGGRRNTQCAIVRPLQHHHPAVQIKREVVEDENQLAATESTTTTSTTAAAATLLDLSVAAATGGGVRWDQALQFHKEIFCTWIFI